MPGLVPDSVLSPLSEWFPHTNKHLSRGFGLHVLILAPAALEFRIWEMQNRQQPTRCHTD